MGLFDWDDDRDEGWDHPIRRLEDFFSPERAYEDEQERDLEREERDLEEIQRIEARRRLAEERRLLEEEQIQENLEDDDPYDDGEGFFF